MENGPAGTETFQYSRLHAFFTPGGQ